jgi:hypothetical protein
MQLRPGQFYTPSPLHRAWGELRIQRVEAPEVGKHWVVKTPSGYLTKLVTLSYSLVTSAQVASRHQMVRVVEPVKGATICHIESDSTTEAGKTSQFSVVSGGYPAIAPTNGAQMVGIPDLWLPPEYTIEDATNLQTEDQAGEVTALVERFELNPDHELAAIENIRHAIDLLEAATNG